MAQPALSQAIHALERDLGVDLLDRGRQGVTPTAAGRRFATHGRPCGRRRRRCRRRRARRREPPPGDRRRARRAPRRSRHRVPRGVPGDRGDRPRRLVRHGAQRDPRRGRRRRLRLPAVPRAGGDARADRHASRRSCTAHGTRASHARARSASRRSPRSRCPRSTRRSRTSSRSSSTSPRSAAMALSSSTTRRRRSARRRPCSPRAGRSRSRPRGCGSRCRRPLATVPLLDVPPVRAVARLPRRRALAGGRRRSCRTYARSGRPRGPHAP